LSVLTKRNGLIIASLLALGLGAMEGNRALLALGGMLAAILAVGFWLSRGLLDRFGASRSHYPRCLEDETLDVELRLWNDGRRPAGMLEIEDQFYPSLNYKVLSLAGTPIMPGEEAALAYRRTCTRHRGVYALGPLRLRAADPLGLFPQERELETFTELRVTPRGAQLECFDALGRGTHFGVGAETARRPGPGEEFFQLRDYRRGDSPRLIHWPSTARRRRMLVKEFNVDVSTEMAIFVDLTLLAHTGLGDVTTAEWAIKACASIAESAIEQQHRVGLFFVNKSVERFPFGGGPEHLNQILDRLTVAGVGGAMLFHEAVAENLRFVRRGATAVFVVTATPLDIDRMDSILRHLLAEGTKAVVVLIDDKSFPKIYAEQEAQHGAAAPMDVIATRFALSGAEMYRLARGDDLKERLSLPDFSPAEI